MNNNTNGLSNVSNDESQQLKDFKTVNNRSLGNKLNRELKKLLKELSKKEETKESGKLDQAFKEWLLRNGSKSHYNLSDSKTIKRLQKADKTLDVNRLVMKSNGHLENNGVSEEIYRKYSLKELQTSKKEINKEILMYHKAGEMSYLVDAFQRLAIVREKIRNKKAIKKLEKIIGVQGIEGKLEDPELITRVLSPDSPYLSTDNKSPLSEIPCEDLPQLNVDLNDFLLLNKGKLTRTDKYLVEEKIGETQKIIENNSLNDSSSNTTTMVEIKENFDSETNYPSSQNESISSKNMDNQKKEHVNEGRVGLK